MKDDEKICIRSKKGLSFHKIKNIQFFEAAGRYTLMRTSRKKTIITETLKNIEKKINNQAFVRISRSTLVNINYISEYSSEKNEIFIKNGKIFSISMRKKSLFLKKINAYYK